MKNNKQPDAPKPEGEQPSKPKPWNIPEAALDAAIEIVWKAVERRKAKRRRL